MPTPYKFKQLVTKFWATGFLVASVILSPAPSHAAGKDGDARIKTLIYNESEVFRIIMRNGFQTDVELAQDEVIDTLSIGDSIGWQLTPASHRIFIKPLQRNGVTNLSVITNKRTYQFELVATNPTNNTPDHAYVVKFYYPDSEHSAAPIDRTRGSMRPVSSTAIPELPSEMAAPAPARPPMMPPVLPGDTKTPAPAPQAAAVMAPPAPAAPMMPPVLPGDMKAPPIMMGNSAEGYNFNYTLSGPEETAPIKIYDDGRSTFFQFRNPPSPAMNFAKVMPDGTEVPLPARPDSGDKIIVDQIGSKFTIRDGSTLICVFNEQASAAAAQARQ